MKKALIIFFHKVMILIFLLLVFFCIFRFCPLVGYTPVLLNENGECYRDKSLCTAKHLDAVEKVLGFYGESRLRIKDKLLISFELWLDNDLLQNYTTKARIEEASPGAFGW